MIIIRNKKNGEDMFPGDVMKIASDSDKYIILWYRKNNCIYPSSVLGMKRQRGLYH